MTGDQHKRPWVAAVLAAVYPGLGHAYLRAWGRSLLWFAVIVVTAIMLIPEEVIAGMTALGDIPAAWEAMPTEATVGIPLVALLSVIDAYWTAKQMYVTEEGIRCPSCGRTVDEDLSFCHWCTTELSIESA